MHLYPYDISYRTPEGGIYVKIMIMNMKLDSFTCYCFKYFEVLISDFLIKMTYGENFPD